MKKMIILAACMGTLSATAVNAQISFAPEAGINLANMHGSSQDTAAGSSKKKDENKLKLGVRVGANVNIPVGERLVVQPGLFYSLKGFKSDMTGTLGTVSYETQNNVTLHYFEIPVNLQYMFNDPSEGRFFVGVGGFIGFAFSGHNKTSTSLGTTTLQDTTIDLTFGDDKTKVNVTSMGTSTTEYRRIDGGLQFNAGYLLRSGIFFRGMYQWGLANLIPGESSTNTIHSSNICISLGYMLGGTPKSKGPRMKGSAPM